MSFLIPSSSGLATVAIPIVVMGGLAIARVPYGTCLRWVWPLLAILAGLTIVAVSLGAAVS